MHKSLMISVVVFLSGCGRFQPETPVILDELRIDVVGQSRELGYTNKQAGFFYTHTNAEHTSGWNGWHVLSAKILDDYLLTVDSRHMSKSSVHLTRVFPHQFQRAYPSGLQETVTLLDSINALVIQASAVKGSTFGVIPMFSFPADTSAFRVHVRGDVLLVPLPDGGRSLSHRVPRWVGVAVNGPNATVRTGVVRTKNRLGPGAVEASLRNGTSVAVLAAGHTEEETLALVQRVREDHAALIDQRARRMEKILNRTRVRTSDARFDRAIHWAILSLDALIMDQRKKGIFAGLPWFSNYWGRDSFISLAGATVVQGDFKTARDILESFAAWQDTNSSSPTVGRIPNLVTPTSIIYNTADGTPRFVDALGAYITASGDIAFARTTFPVIRRAAEAALTRTDRYGLLTHGDAETWMDAVGPEGPWSPRGNRANDIQALWYRQLLISSWLASLNGDERRFREWFSYAEQVQLSFNRLFLNRDSAMMYDHLNADGSPDVQFRPNQLFALDLVNDSDTRSRIFRICTQRLVYAHGIASLSQDDERFHPYHHYRPYYVQDAAYHNGIVWTWLAGPWVSAATRLGYTEKAFEVTQNLTDQILDRGAVGTLSELLDAVPRPGESAPRLSGTFSQAWSLAEFVRTLYDDYLGVAVDAIGHRIELAPRLPQSMSDASFNVAMGDHVYRVGYRNAQTAPTIVLSSPPGAPATDVVVNWQITPGKDYSFAYVLTSATEATVSIESDGVYVSDPLGSRTIQPVDVQTFDPDSTVTPALDFALPHVRTDLPSMMGPGHRLLANNDVKASNPGAHVLFDLADPAGDDRGPGTYVYPTSPSLQPGSLDLTRFTLSADEDHAFFTLKFRALSDPGWHPEYGFQLTFAAIAIDKDRRPESGQRTVGRNARHRLPASRAYETIVFVGGGVRVEESTGVVLAEYVPVPGDENNPLGDASTGVITFSLPLALIGTPSSGWSCTVLVGAQDDHGGAGIGDFRAVEARGGEWTGGGKQHRAGSNVYDSMVTGSPHP